MGAAPNMPAVPPISQAEAHITSVTPSSHMPQKTAPLCPDDAPIRSCTRKTSPHRKMRSKRADEGLRDKVSHIQIAAARAAHSKERSMMPRHTARRHTHNGRTTWERGAEQESRLLRSSNTHAAAPPRRARHQIAAVSALLQPFRFGDAKGKGCRPTARPGLSMNRQAIAERLPNHRPDLACVAAARHPTEDPRRLRTR